jgi:hypothetical protein
MRVFCFKVLGDGESNIVLLVSFKTCNFPQHLDEFTAFYSF